MQAKWRPVWRMAATHVFVTQVLSFNGEWEWRVHATATPSHYQCTSSGQLHSMMVVTYRRHKSAAHQEFCKGRTIVAEAPKVSTAERPL